MTVRGHLCPIQPRHGCKGSVRDQCDGGDRGGRGHTRAPEHGPHAAVQQDGRRHAPERANLVVQEEGLDVAQARHQCQRVVRSGERVRIDDVRREVDVAHRRGRQVGEALHDGDVDAILVAVERRPDRVQPDGWHDEHQHDQDLASRDPERHPACPVRHRRVNRPDRDQDAQRDGGTPVHHQGGDRQELEQDQAHADAERDELHQVQR